MKYYPPRYLFRRYEILRGIACGHNFLEVGPGNLQLSQELLRFFDNGMLIDYNPDVENVYHNLSAANKERLQLIIADLTYSAPIREKYDCVVACEVIEHVEHDDCIVKTMIELLNEDGQLIISVPSREKFWSNHDEIVGHVRRYEKKQLIDLLSKQGLSDIEVISYGYPFVNILRWPRILLAALQYRKKNQWSQQKQTQESGLMKSNPLINLIGVFCNQYTTYPLNLVASLFNRYDLSDGYVVFARKS
ncbi:MAG: methyltransferase domain-containing protein [Anaerolineae bacterium]|nr:methyltransferase domain-containing protein [Anaerolineae bacterium]